MLQLHGRTNHISQTPICDDLSKVEPVLLVVEANRPAWNAVNQHRPQLARTWRPRMIKVPTLLSPVEDIGLDVRSIEIEVLVQRKVQCPGEWHEPKQFFQLQHPAAPLMDK